MRGPVATSTTPLNPSQKARAQRRDQILAAAREVFAEKGYDATAVADIVRAAGVAQGTFYLYFPAKRDAFFALAEEFFAEMAGHVGEALAQGGPVPDRVRALTRSCFRAADQNADLVRLVFFGADSAATEAAQRFAERNPVVEAVREMIEADVEAGRLEISDPEVTARLLVGLVRTAVLEAYVVGRRADAKRLERATAEMFTRVLTGGD